MSSHNAASLYDGATDPGLVLLCNYIPELHLCCYDTMFTDGTENKTRENFIKRDYTAIYHPAKLRDI